jgi:hypothetical protein
LLDLLVNPHASLVAREKRVSFSKVWRLAERECIDLAAGRAAKGYLSNFYSVKTDFFKNKAGRGLAKPRTEV